MADERDERQERNERHDAAEHDERRPAGERGGLGRLFAALVSTGDDEALPDVPEEAPEEADGNTTVLDVEGLSRSLASSPDPMALLSGLVVDVRGRSGAAGAPGDGDAPALPPSPLETHLAARLVEAGLLETDVELPSLHVIRPRTSDLFYLRLDDQRVSYLALLRVMRIEAALNSVLLASHVLPDPNEASLEEIVRAEQRVARSVTAQAADVASRADGPALGEWDVRRALSFGIESFRLPYRLTARFRVNVSRGLAAFELDLVPPEVWAATCYVDGLGVVPATSEMRRRFAADYNARLAVLVAGYAFRVAPQLSEVWVAGVVDTSTDHACHYSGALGRSDLEGVDLSGSFDAAAVLRAAGFALAGPEPGSGPVRQTFSLEDERLCPPGRYDPPELSDRVLGGAAAASLGCGRVDGLAADEAARRRRVASDLVRGLGGSTEQNVRLLLSAAREDGHPDVLDAARRCVSMLVEGALEDDPVAIEEELVDGSDLARACARARDALSSRDVEAARDAVEAALLPVDGLGTYDDTDTVTWRSFDTYAERALYNRLLARPGEECRLVPAAYLEAHMIAAAADLALGLVEGALSHARRAVELAPLSSQASGNLAQCLEAADETEAAEEEARRLLSLAHDPEGLGTGYLCMAQLQWQRGRVLVAQACYQRATRYLGAPAIMAGFALAALVGHVAASAGASLDAGGADSVLRGAGVPLAPTEEVGAALLEAARAATNEGVFPVARDLVRELCALSRDDVLFGLYRSIEDEPDR